MDQMIYYLTEHCHVYNIIFVNVFECAVILNAGIHFSNAKISQVHLHQLRQVHFHERKWLGNENRCQTYWYIFWAILKKSLLLYFSQFSVWRNLSWITMHDVTVAGMRRCRGFCPILTVVPQNSLFFFKFSWTKLIWCCIHVVYRYSLKLFSQIYEKHFFAKW